MNMISCEAFSELEREIVEDFMECLQENVDAIEDVLSRLDDSSDIELINHLFRDVHSFKGNCRMVFLDPVVEITHSLEEIVQEMRQGSRVYHPAYRDFISEIIFRVVSMIRELYAQGEIDSTPKDTMLVLITNVHQSKGDAVYPALQEALIELTGESKAEKFACNVKEVEEPVSAPALGDQERDLAYFKKLAERLDALNIYRADRSKQLLELCLATNQELNNLVDEKQLTAAVYVHDLGMALVPKEVIEKPGTLSPEEFAIIKEHIEVGAGMLERVPGWEEAAQMVFQHHEKFDGSGYPKGLSGDDIHPGAKIIALADTYYAVTNQRVDRSYKKSLFSAVSLINGASGYQFDPVFVDGFNEIVRRLYVGKK